MAKKTNKTSHVMDLLTNGASGDSGPASDSAAPSQDTAAGQEKKTDVQSHSVTPKKVTVVDEGSRNDRVSQEILNKLSEELAADTKQEATPDMSTQTSPESSNRTMSPDEIAAAFAAAAQPAQETPKASPEPAPAPESSNRTMSPDEIAAAFAAAAQPAQETPKASPEPAPAPESSNRTMSPDEIAAAFAAAAQPAQETPKASSEPAPTVSPAATGSTEAAPQPSDSSSAPAVSDNKPTKISPQMVIPKSQISNKLTDDEYHFVNVMEQLILRQDIDSYLEQYNVCKCRRCVSDVCALALSGLPSKYVVTSKDSLSPILSYYESKYRIYMLTELIKACNKVRENPRHKK